VLKPIWTEKLETASRFRGCSASMCQRPCLRAPTRWSS